MKMANQPRSNFLNQLGVYLTNKKPIELSGKDYKSLRIGEKEDQQLTNSI
jgi:hypothetical protein